MGRILAAAAVLLPAVLVAIAIPLSRRVLIAPYLHWLRPAIAVDAVILLAGLRLMRKGGDL